jgi:hypothetical protein
MTYATQIQDLEKEFHAKVETLFRQATSEFFTKHPEVKTISWTQYVPAFNDGDPCEFTMGEVTFASVDWQEFDSPHWADENEDEEKLSWSSYSSDKEFTSPTLKADIKDMEHVILGSQGILESLYGADVWVRMHANGVEVDEFDCGY